MKLKSLRSRLLISVSVLVIGSGLFISILETKRFSKSFHESTITQGEYLSQELALEATNDILINDLIALQNLLNNHLSSNPSVAYIFVVKDGEVLAHTFSDGIPVIQGLVLLTGLYLGLSRGLMGLRDVFHDSRSQIRAMVLPAAFALLAVNVLLKLYMG